MRRFPIPLELEVKLQESESWPRMKAAWRVRVRGREL